MEPRKSIFNMVKTNRLGIVPNTALFMDRDFDQLEKVKDMSSTLIKLYLA
jgi:hypothetical protein